MQLVGGARAGAFAVVNPIDVLTAGATAQVELRFTADSVTGADAASLLIESDADDQPRVSIALVGRTAATGCDGGATDAGLGRARRRRPAGRRARRRRWRRRSGRRGPAGRRTARRRWVLRPGQRGAVADHAPGRHQRDEPGGVDGERVRRGVGGAPA